MKTTTCQICGREIKASNGIIAHHGYKRPYQAGWQSASCAGARYAPYEVSCDRLREVVEMVKNFIVSQEKSLAVLLATPPQTITVYERRSSFGKEEKIEYAKPDDFKQDSYRNSIPRTYENAYSNRKHDYERDIRAAKTDLSIMERRLNEWKPPMERPYNENAGYLAEGQYNGADIVFYNAEKAGMDVDGKYAVVCETHNCLVGTTSMPKAREIMKCPDFCQDCMPEAFE